MCVAATTSGEGAVVCVENDELVVDEGVSGEGGIDIARCEIPRRSG